MISSSSHYNYHFMPFTKSWDTAKKTRTVDGVVHRKTTTLQNAPSDPRAMRVHLGSTTQSEILDLFWVGDGPAFLGHHGESWQSCLTFQAADCFQIGQTIQYQLGQVMHHCKLVVIGQETIWVPSDMLSSTNTWKWQSPQLDLVSKGISDRGLQLLVLSKPACQKGHPLEEFWQSGVAEVNSGEEAVKGFRAIIRNRCSNNYP